MPEHSPFRKLSGERQIDLWGLAQHSLMSSLENKTRCPVVGESQKALAQDLCLPAAEKQLPIRKLWAARAHPMLAAERLSEEVPAPSCSLSLCQGWGSLQTCRMYNHSTTWRCQDYLSWLKCVVHFNDSCSAAGRKHQLQFLPRVQKLYFFN